MDRQPTDDILYSIPVAQIVPDALGIDVTPATKFPADHHYLFPKPRGLCVRVKDEILPFVHARHIGHRAVPAAIRSSRATPGKSPGLSPRSIEFPSKYCSAFLRLYCVIAMTTHRTLAGLWVHVVYQIHLRVSA